MHERIGIPKNRARSAYRRHLRVRKKVKGTAERPRLVVFRSLKHIYAQLVDDVAARTLMTVTISEGRRREEDGEVARSRQADRRRAPRTRGSRRSCSTAAGTSITAA